MPSSISSSHSTHYSATHQTLRTSAKGDEKNKATRIDATPRVLAIAMLISSVIIGSLLFGTGGVIFAPILCLVGLTYVGSMTGKNCFTVTKAYESTPKHKPNSTPASSHSYDASPLY